MKANHHIVSLSLGTVAEPNALVADLQAFDPKPVARNMDLRGGRNADLVFALAVAIWWGDDLTWGDKWFGMPGLAPAIADRAVGY